MMGEPGQTTPTPTFKSLERDGYHAQAATYGNRPGRLTRQAIIPMLEAVAAAPGMRLLDLCCGPGYGAGEAAARGLDAVGIDIAPGMVAEARRGFPGVTFHEGDAEALTFSDGSFDAVICSFGLMHLPEPDKAIEEVFRVLKTGGRFAATVWAPAERADLLRLAVAAITAHADMSVNLPPGPSLFMLSDPAVATSKLNQAGFVDTSCKDLPIVYRPPNATAVWDWFDRGTVRSVMLVRLQTPEIQARIRDTIIESARRYETSDGLVIPNPAILYAARKPG
jgi:SAM-dependent methyltransferase